MSLYKVLHFKLNCDPLSAVRQMENPKFFYNNLPVGVTEILDEIHQISHPGIVLKLALMNF